MTVLYTVVEGIQLHSTQKTLSRTGQGSVSFNLIITIFKIRFALSIEYPRVLFIILCVGRGNNSNWQTDTLKEGQWLGREVSTNYVNFAFPAQLGLSLETTNDNKYTIQQLPRRKHYRVLLVFRQYRHT